MAVVPPHFESAYYSLVAAKPVGEAVKEHPESVEQAIHFRKFDQGETKGGHLPSSQTRAVKVMSNGTQRCNSELATSVD